MKYDLDLVQVVVDHTIQAIALASFPSTIHYLLFFVVYHCTNLLYLVLQPARSNTRSKKKELELPHLSRLALRAIISYNVERRYC
jgi:hypothetical protein